MKLLTTMTAVLVMAATGCETAQQKEARGLVQNRYGEWLPKGARYFGDGINRRQEEPARPAVAYNGPPPPASVFNAAPIYVPPAQVGSPAVQPVVVVGPGSGTTIASQTGVGTVISSFGGYRPIVPPVPYQYYGY